MDGVRAEGVRCGRLLPPVGVSAMMTMSMSRSRRLWFMLCFVCAAEAAGVQGASAQLLLHGHRNKGDTALGMRCQKC